MSIQRFHAYHSGDPHKVGLWADPEGHWVQYADHVAAVEQAERDGYTRCQEDVIRGRGFASFGQLVWHESSYRRGVQDEKSRIKQAVEDLDLWRFCDDNGCRMKAAVLAAIDRGDADGA